MRSRGSPSSSTRSACAEPRHEAHHDWRLRHAIFDAATLETPRKDCVPCWRSALSLGACGDGGDAATAPAGCGAARTRRRCALGAPRLERPRSRPARARRTSSALAFKIGGVIERIEVDEGDAVHRGALLAVLERTEIDAAVERAAESVGKAERDLKRTRALYAEDVATLEQVEDLGRLRSTSRARISTRPASTHAMRGSRRPRTASCSSAAPIRASSLQPARPCSSLAILRARLERTRGRDRSRRRAVGRRR